MSKARNHIDEKKAIQILKEAYGLQVQKINFYQLRIRNEEKPNIFFDWYHTTGSVVVNTNSTYYKAIDKIVDPEELAIRIQKYIYEKI